VAVTGPTAAICQNAPVNLNASGASTYSWSNGATGASITPVATVNTTYSVVGTNTAGCTGTANISVTVTAAPSITAAGAATICAGSNQTITLSISGAADSYSWSTGPTTTSISVSPTVTTTYVAYGTSTLTGCTGNSSVTIVVSPCTGIDQSSLSGNLKVYPNPSSGEITVEVKNGIATSIDVTDISGRVVLSASAMKDKTSINISHFASGIYYLKVQSSQGIDVIKIIKQ
jgi:hypothetical protein